LPCTELLETESLHVLEACAEHKAKRRKTFEWLGDLASVARALVVTKICPKFFGCIY